MSPSERKPALRVGMIGAGTMARAHSAALVNLRGLFPDAPFEPRFTVVADVNDTLAADVAARYGYERVERDWRRVVTAPDVDLICASLPPVLNREVVLEAAAAGKHVVCEKPLGATAAVAAELRDACTAAGVFHGLGLGYRWTPALRAIRSLIERGDLGAVRHVQASFMLDYAADPEVPLLWRFRRSVAGGGLAIDTGYHLVDCARFLIGEIDAVQALTAIFVSERPLPGTDAIGNSGRASAGATGVGPVDCEDAAAALLHFAGGAYGILETSRVAIGRRIALQIAVFGSEGSATWDLERPDEFHLCRTGEELTFGFRRILVNPTHPGASSLLLAGTDGTSVGWLGQQCAMWDEFLRAIAEERPAAANFEDGVRANAVIDALYEAARSGARTDVAATTALSFRQ